MLIPASTSLLSKHRLKCRRATNSCDFLTSLALEHAYKPFQWYFRETWFDMSSREKKMVARDLGTKRESLIFLTHIISSSATKKESRSITEMSNAKEQRQQTKPGLKSFPSQLWKQIMALKEFFSYSQRDRRVTPRKLNFPSWNSWF